MISTLKFISIINVIPYFYLLLFVQELCSKEPGGFLISTRNTIPSFSLIWGLMGPGLWELNFKMLPVSVGIQPNFTINMLVMGNVGYYVFSDLQKKKKKKLSSL